MSASSTPSPDASPYADEPSPFRRLRDRYGVSTSHQAINRAIRELPGGALALDALARWHDRCQRWGWGDGRADLPPHVLAYVDCLEIADALEDAVRAQHGLPARPERADWRRATGRGSSGGRRD